MYKHAWSRKETPPTLRLTESRTERQIRLTLKYLVSVADSWLSDEQPPSMPRHLYSTYKSSINSLGGVIAWAQHRPEWDKALAAAKRDKLITQNRKSALARKRRRKKKNARKTTSAPTRSS